MPKKPAAKTTPGNAADERQALADWADEFLRDWVAEAHPSDRESRQWVADGWRRGVTLEEIMHWWQSDREFEHAQVDRRVRDLAGLYRSTLNGLAAWRIYREFRSRALPVPEFVLVKFDDWASKLEGASGATEVAAAIGLAVKRGGAGGAAALRKFERRRAIASEVHQLLTWNPPLKPEAAYARVASQRGMTKAAVKRLWTEWRRDAAATKRADSTNSADLIRWPARKVR